MKRFRTHHWRDGELWMHIQNGRYVAYAQALENWTESYDEILLCDVRDTVFQCDPFRAEHNYGIGYFEEHPRQKIGVCPDNSTWIKQAYGQKIFKQMKDQTVICSGITYLKMSHALQYLHAMISGMEKANVRNHIDQGIHNYLARYNVVAGGEIITQDKSTILTVGANPAESFQRNEQGLLLNEQGQVASTIHQYDRIPGLKDSLFKALQLA